MIDGDPKGGFLQGFLGKLGNTPGEKGVPREPKGVRSGVGKGIDSILAKFTDKPLSQAKKNQWKTIFTILGETLLIGKFAPKPEAESLQGGVVQDVAGKVESSEEEKQKGKPAKSSGGLLDGLFGDLLKGAIGIGAMILALGALAFVLKEYAGIPATSLFKAAGALLGLIGIAKFAKDVGLIKPAIGLGALTLALWGLSYVLKEFETIGLETIIKAGAALGGLVYVGKQMEGFASGKFFAGVLGLGLITGVLWLLIEKGLKPLQSIDWSTIGKAFVSLLAIGTIGAVAGLAAPYIVVGAIALGILGVALLPFAAAVNIAAPGIAELTNVMNALAEVPVQNLFLIGPALVGIGVGLAAMSGGNLISNILDGFGKLFGGEGPLDKLARLGEAAPEINKLGASLDKLGEIDLDDLKITGEPTIVVNGINMITASVDSLTDSQTRAVGLFERMTASAKNFLGLGGADANVNITGTKEVTSTINVTKKTEDKDSVSNKLTKESTPLVANVDNFGMDSQLIQANQQQVSLLTEIKDGILELVKKPVVSSQNQESQQSSQNSFININESATNKIKRNETTNQFNQALGLV